MNFQVVISISLFLSLCTCAPNDYSLSDFYALFENLKQQAPPMTGITFPSSTILCGEVFLFPFFHSDSKIYVKFEGSSGYVNFVFNYFNDNTLECLNEASFYDRKFDDIYFANLFFKIISGEKNKDQHLYIYQSYSQIVINTQYHIELAIQKILFAPFDSLSELQDNISVVRQLIEFLKKYSKSSSNNKDYEIESCPASIADWENLMSYLLDKSPHGNVDFNFLISFIHLQNGSKSLFFPHQGSEFKMNCLIFASYLNQLIGRKGFNIFKFDHPNLVFLLAFILKITDDYGNSTLSEFDSFIYYQSLIDFFEFGTDSLKLLNVFQINKAKVLSRSIERVGGETSGPCWISHLTMRFEEYFDEHSSDENRNLLFQLKCLSAIENHHKPEIQ
jgi:hypothetical protein